MGLKGFKVLPANTAEWDRFFRGQAIIPDVNSVDAGAIKDGSVTNPKLADRAVTNVKLRDSAPFSVIGRTVSESGTPSDIQFNAENLFLVRRAGVLGAGPIIESDLPATIARDTEITAAITAHEAAVDPHPQYLTQTEGDARYGLSGNSLNASLTYDPPNLINGARDTATVTVTGAALGDFARASFSIDLQGITLFAWVSATDTAKVLFFNQTGGTIDLASATLRVRVDKA